MMTQHPNRLLASRTRRTGLVAASLCSLFAMAACEEGSGDASDQAQQSEPADPVATSPAMRAAEEVVGSARGSAPSAPPAGEVETPEVPSPDSLVPGDIPESWTFDPEPRQMRLATFMIPSDDGDIEVAITRFGGDVGGELANVNRWRRQMGLGPVDETGLEDTLTRFEAAGFSGYETRIESDSAVLLASAVYEQAEDRTWFVRVNTTPQSADRIEAEVFGFARSMAGAE